MFKMGTNGICLMHPLSSGTKDTIRDLLKIITLRKLEGCLHGRM